MKRARETTRKKRCEALTQEGRLCKRYVTNECAHYCYQHGPAPMEVEHETEVEHERGEPEVEHETGEPAGLPGGPSQKKVRLMLEQALAADPQSVSERLALADAMADPDFKARQCDFDYLHSMKPNIKKSASDTSVFFADAGALLNGRPGKVAVKVSYATVDYATDNSLIVEQLNYKYVINTIIVQGWSPHVLAYVGSFRCPIEALQRLPKDVAKNIKRDLICARKSADEEYNELDVFERRFGQVPKDLDFIITEMARNPVPLKEWIWPIKKIGKFKPGPVLCPKDRRPEESIPSDLSNLPSLTQMKAVLFQVLYTFEVFNRLGFRHNDAHLSNILIEDWSGVSRISHTRYEIDGAQYSVPSRDCFVKLFDFDRSGLDCDLAHVARQYCPIIEQYENALRSRTGIDACDNTALSSTFCRDFGQCTTRNTKYDAYLTCSFLHDRIAEAMDSIAALGASVDSRLVDYREVLSQVDTFLTQSIDFNSIRKKYADPDSPHWMFDKGAFPTDGEMHHVYTMLQESDFFSVFYNAPAPEGSVIYQMPDAPEKT